MQVLLLLLFCLLSTSSPLRADTTYVAQGFVSGTWTSEGSPYIIEGAVTVDGPDSLFIGPGVRVFFAGHYGLLVMGTLQATGALEDSVVFTADVQTDTVGWRGLTFDGISAAHVLAYSVVENARKPDYGGGIFSGAPHVTIEHSSIRHCQASFGRGMYVSDGATVDMSDSEIQDNPGITGVGGAMVIDQRAQVSLVRCAILRNGAMDGGAIDLYSGILNLTDCLFEDNAANIWGGAVFSDGAATLTVSGCTFRGNSSLQGGAIDAQDSTTLELDHCLFVNNRAFNGSNGGATGAVVAHGIGTTISNCTFVGNWDAQNYGTLSLSGPGEVKNSIFAFAPQGNGIRFGDSWPQVHHCAFFDNLGANFVGTVPEGLGVVDTVNFNGDPCDDFSNIFLDPVFADTALGDYHLTEGSPCIDAGDPASPHDPDGTIADMGAFYFSQLGVPRDGGRTAVRHYELYPNYPNPFNAVTTISFDLPRESDVLLNVFDITGRSVATLANGMMAAGVHRVNFDASKLPSGVYVYRLQANGFSQGRKLVILK